MKKILKATFMIAILLVSSMVYSSNVKAATYNSVILSSSWQTIASSSSGFNCNVTIRCFVTGTDGLGAIRPDIRMLNQNGQVVWAENRSCPGLGSRTYWCGSNVYRIQIKVATGGGSAYSNPA